ncbi:Uncharacterised protein [Mycobacteroides abscessus subsp. bolletii]|nr:Uncharacterised protein [Mycobacteroides abscessus subsp. bolletii]
MSDAQKLILEALRKSLPPFDGFGHACAVAAAEVDKALGGLTTEYCARHHSGGGAPGFATKADALRHIADHPPVSGGVERPPDSGYSGVESRFVSGWAVTE